MPPKILISGAGIAGPALAFWLARLGHEVTIVEQAANLRASGQQIDLRGQAVEVMRRMGIEPAVRAKVVDEAGVQLVDESGAPRAVFVANKTGKGKQSATSEFEIMRGDLCRILVEAAGEKVKYIFGTRVESYEQPDDDGVNVKFSDGRAERFDLLVVADGQNSRLRGMMLGEGTADPFRFLDLYVAYFTIPRIESDTNYASICHFPDYRIAVTRADNPETIQAYLGITESPGRTDRLAKALGDRTVGVAEQKKIWAEIFRDLGWEVPRILKGMMESREADDFYCQRVGQVRTESWSKGRVVLLGDAGYCPSPITGFGTSAALIGAYVLAGELARHGGSGDGAGVDVAAALAGYDAVLRPLIDKVQSLPPGVPGIVYFKTRWGIRLLHAITGFVTMTGLDRLAQSFMSDDVGGWTLPEYDELRYR